MTHNENVLVLLKLIELHQFFEDYSLDCSLEDEIREMYDVVKPRDPVEFYLNFPSDNLSRMIPFMVRRVKEDKNKRNH